MEQSYLTIFKEIANATSRIAEQGMDYNKQKDDLKGYAAGKTMRDDFAALSKNLENKDYTLNKQDCAKLLVGALLITNNIEKRIEEKKKSLTYYRTDIIPKLDRIISTNDEEATSLIIEIFNN